MDDDRFKFDWQRAIRALCIGTTPKLLALILSTYADKRGGNIHPGNDRLAAELEMTPRAVEINLGRLQELGVIERTRRGGGNAHNRWAAEYRLALPGDLGERAEFVKIGEYRVRRPRRGQRPNTGSGGSAAGAAQHPNGDSGSYSPATEPRNSSARIPKRQHPNTGSPHQRRGDQRRDDIKDVGGGEGDAVAEVEGKPPGAAEPPARDQSQPPHPQFDTSTRAGTDAARRYWADRLAEQERQREAGFLDPEQAPATSYRRSNGHRRPGLAQDLINAIAARPGQTSKELRAAVNGHTQRVFAELKRLQDEGLVRRVVDPADRRRVGYHLAAP